MRFNDNIRIRKNIVNVILLLILAVLLYKIIFLHTLKVHNEKTLREKGINQSTKIVNLKSYRGNIFDRNGNAIALTVPIKEIIIDPTLLDKQLYSKVANLLNISKQELVNKINNKSSRRYLKIKSNLEFNDPIVTNFRKFINTQHRLYNSKTKKYYSRYIGGAVILDTGTKRYYPQTNSSAALIGLVNKNNVGISGIEQAYNSVLYSKDGKKLMAFAGKDVYANVKMLQEQKQGKDIVLTINNDIQYFAYTAVKSTVDKYNANYGSAIILTPSGEVLAMVNYPSDNPNNRDNYIAKNYRNRVLANSIEVGSTMKPFIVSLALDKQKINLNEFINVSRAISIYKPDNKYKKLTPRQIIEKSHNLGIISIGELLSKKDIWGMLKNLGFGNNVNIIPNIENNGILKHSSKWSKSDKYTITFGYGPMNATLAQLARAYLVFLNDGAITDLKIIKDNKKTKFKQVFSKESILEMVKILDSTVSDTASGYAAQIKDYDIAGKTGTTQLLNKNGKGYDKDRHGTFFAGFVPAYKPKYLMIVNINNPKTRVAEGSNIAAPVFKNAMVNILKLETVH